MKRRLRGFAFLDQRWRIRAGIPFSNRILIRRWQHCETGTVVYEMQGYFDHNGRRHHHHGWNLDGSEYGWTLGMVLDTIRRQQRPREWSEV